MIKPDIHKLTGSDIWTEISADELLIIIPDSTEAPSNSLAQAITDRAHFVLEESFFQATLGLYIFRENPSARILVLKWQENEISTFEARWVSHRLFAKLSQLVHSPKVAVFLPGKATPLQMAMAEDIYFSACSTLFDSSPFECFRLLVQNEAQLPSTEAYTIRFQGHLSYRQWINENPDTMTSQTLGDRLQQFALDHNLEFTKMRTARLEEERLNLIVAVGKASEASPPRMFILRHNCHPGSSPLVLIGKGITFDAGGLNIKTADRFIDTMKNDMGGAALMSNLFMALVKLGYKGPLALVIPSCENVIGPDALRPGTILKNRKGRSIIVENTDAEGRLLLADAISYADELLNPSQIITAATLTVASLKQFSSYVTPVYFSSSAFEGRLRESGKIWGEEFAFNRSFLPFEVANHTMAADLTNTGRLPGLATEGSRSNIAAHFLKSFARAPFVHLDIFCTTWNWAGDYPGARYGATGAAFNSLLGAL